MAKEHQYQATLTWAGNKGSGTMDYRSYDRSYIISIDNKPDISGSSDSAFLGDKTKHNPEDLLLASLSSCHMLWYLHLCSQNEIIVMDYKDTPIGKMTENSDGSGHFNEVVLNPVVVITDESQIEKANSLHDQAHKMCFIANSCNFPIKHNPKSIVERG
ncbi:OsmC family peroxiredoxin [Pedobacter hiemivivus]|uniref:OsmC family peroxiredoxin n=1 Tax=Pedobacter hiemivivus TaxID=2530454 RepID=A0A4U1GB64_9SPHI|nr:OsmC family protein [Pedobacter hiemivivus]TCC81976.1 OsmC family peroxiredoxin [Pedobacter hiemivivus]TKC61008.1 OsmC family peroxiredoxin [Pedobacter hiemivivus]